MRLHTIVQMCVCSLGVTVAAPSGAQTWEQRACDDPNVGRNQLVYAPAARATLGPKRAALVVIASVSDSALTEPLNGFAVWLARPAAYPGDSLGLAVLSGSLSSLYVERAESGAHLLRVRRIAFAELRDRMTLRAGFVDTVFAHLRTHRVCLRGIPPR